MTNGQLVLVGKARNTAFRMTSLLPSPLGQGTRRNSKKRDFTLKNVAALEYRTCACADAEQAHTIERERLRNRSSYLFPT